MSTTTRHGAGAANWAIALCWPAIMLDGFDLVVFGVVLPPLLDDPAWARNRKLRSTKGFGVGTTAAAPAGARSLGVLFGDGMTRSTLAIWVTSYAFAVVAVIGAVAAVPHRFPTNSKMQGRQDDPI
jgi:hypothetical protein